MKENSDTNIIIVVHYEEGSGWFLDTYNWNIQEIWDSKPEHTVWL